MSDHDTPPLPDDIKALLSGARTGVDVPAEVPERLLARIRSSTSPGGSGGPVAAPRPPGVHALVARRAWSPLAFFALGALTGVGATALVWSRRPPVVVEVIRRVEAPTRAPTPPVADSGAEADAGAAAAIANTTEAARDGGGAGASGSRPASPRAAWPDPAAERVLLDTARTALMRERPADALAALRRHEARFPRGQLAEERESLRVMALVRAGDHAGARARGDAFRRRFPGSLLRPAVEAALRSIPEPTSEDSVTGPAASGH